MHFSFVKRAVIELVVFMNGQGIHIGAKPDTWAVTGFQYADNAGFRQPTMNFDAK